MSSPVAAPCLMICICVAVVVFSVIVAGDQIMFA